MASLPRAIVIAAEAHENQVDKYGAPYVLHPIRVMLKMETEEARIAAVFHDVVEDSDWTLERLRAEGFSERVVAAVDHLSKRASEEADYDAFILRVMEDPLAAKVKIADLEDNMDPKRIREFTARDAERMAKYHRAWTALRQRESAAR